MSQSRPTAIEQALARLSASLSVLETALSRHLETDRSKGTLETELALMQDDRARLAVELDGALTAPIAWRARPRNWPSASTGPSAPCAPSWNPTSGAEVPPWLLPGLRVENKLGQVTVTIAEKVYRIACDDGQEEHLRNLASDVDAKIEEMRKSFGEIGDNRLTVMAAITFVDERQELRSRLARLESEVAELRSRNGQIETSLGQT